MLDTEPAISEAETLLAERDAERRNNTALREQLHRAREEAEDTAQILGALCDGLDARNRETIQMARDGARMLLRARGVK